ncbi:MAG: hypothetical protein JSS86_07890 [Cyanobacteria bacterium SZAS LIN-2]|nr:hypothetical protein [Cyanobacteria bacterium SZAS LIN-3]MBS1996214.1 hypothetical protein [Cyanobacteria bacterium SZAS LIN-2]MBS2010422.1 hypothetical protein [Cyanobacteria bacterium SZAS TMP-1]
MTNVSITRGCDQEPAQQFNEGADTFVRVCDPASASLIVYSEEPCLIVVKVDGEETLRSVIESNKSYAFPCAEILKIKRSRSQLARAGFLSLIGSKSAKDTKDELASDFLVEIRQAQAGAPIDGSYMFRLLSDEAFDQRFAGYLNERVVEEPKPIFTRDARPIECLANTTKCMACGTVITDCIAGCENAECPTLTPAVQAKVTGADKGKGRGNK